MPMTPFVRTISLIGFQEFATRQGLDPAQMLKLIGLPLQSLQGEDALYPYQQYCALLEVCSIHSGNPLFGLHYGLFQASSAFGDLLFLLRNTHTVGEALTELRTHYRLYNGAADIGLVSENGLTTLSYHVHQPEMPGVRQAQELGCAVGMQLMRLLLGAHWLPDEIRLPHSPGSDPERYVQALGMSPRFDSDSLAMVFASALLEQPVNAPDDAVHHLASRKMERLESLCADGLCSQIRQLLRHLLPSGRATAEKVADIMALTPNALRQAMAEEGTSFQQLLEEVRQGMAREYLSGPSTNVAELARMLGYSEASGFCRAFHRWFGMSPLNWQKTQGVKRQPRLLGRRRKRL
ncbi:AraC family transcriptional regulator [Pseudomonas japonica]|uniref:AraC family transcriptional regulator n=1 Tax=Pseudomonas japonica TaxID=256466 RepID=UPI00380AC3BE